MPGFTKEHPRYVVPGYLAELKDDIERSAPGHKFLLYFKGATVNWESLKSQKYKVLEEVTSLKSATKILNALTERQKYLASQKHVFSFSAKLSAPLTLGLGNPHSIENGFSFLSPYGLPYIPGSGIKGPVKHAAENLALFNEKSKWSIPLVWLLFGFEGNSGYLAPAKKATPDVLKKESEQLRQAFRNWADEYASNDKILKKWLNEIKKQLPQKFKHLCEDPAQFCHAIVQDDQEGKILRSSIAWKGYVHFWDSVPEIKKLSIEILNPHHKEYYEGKTSPHDSESPVPIFFLAIPEDTPCQFVYKISPEASRFCNNVEQLINEAFEETLTWCGLGAKTSVGYGIFNQTQLLQGAENGHDIIDSVPSKTVSPRSEEEIRQEKISSFTQSLPSTDKFPGQAARIVQQIKEMDDPELQQKALQLLFERYKKVIKKAKKKKKAWVVDLQNLAGK